VIAFCMERSGYAVNIDVLDLTVVQFGDDGDSGFFTDAAYLIATLHY